MSPRFLIIVAVTLSFFASLAWAMEYRGIKRVCIEDKSGQKIGVYDESYALIIGISEYMNGWPDLPGVKKDIEAVGNKLGQSGFHVAIEENLNKAQIEKAFNGFINEHGQKPDNRLLFYFAGHGHTMQLSYGGEMGYIVPSDAPNPNLDQNGFLAKSMDMQMIEVYAKRIQSKHAIFLFDSCFSGSLFNTSRSVPEHITYKTSKPVRQFITSGSANETVPDYSIFRHQFISAIDGDGDTNRDGFITGAELGEYLQTQVTNYSKGTQHPQYGKIRDMFLDKGDFVFLAPQPAKKDSSPIQLQQTSIKTSTDADSGEAYNETATLSRSDIHDFIRDYIDAYNKADPALLLKFYSESVDYFDAGIVSSRFIYEDKGRYYKRWPHARYRLVDIKNVIELGQDNEVLVSFLIGFDVYSNSRKKGIKGIAENTFILKRKNEDFRIVSDKQKVLKKQKYP